MLNKTNILQAVEPLLTASGLSGYSVEIRKTRIRDNFFSTNENIFDQICDGESEIEVDYAKWFQSDRPELRRDFRFEAVFGLEDVVQEWADKFCPDNEEVMDYTLDEIEKDYGQDAAVELQNRIESWIDEQDVFELQEVFEVLFGIDFYEQFNEFEVLGYWTIYFQPETWDEDVAWEVGLFPFEYEGHNYLALGGCGMDLSPKLDAYQALTVGSVPGNSQFLRQPDYAKYVVGERVFEKVMKAIQCDPVITIYTVVERR